MERQYHRILKWEIQIKYEGIAQQEEQNKLVGLNFQQETEELKDSNFTFSKLEELKQEMQNSVKEVCGSLQVSYNEMS